MVHQETSGTRFQCATRRFSNGGNWGGKNKREMKQDDKRCRERVKKERNLRKDITTKVKVVHEDNQEMDSA